MDDLGASPGPHGYGNPQMLMRTQTEQHPQNPDLHTSNASILTRKSPDVRSASQNDTIVLMLRMKPDGVDVVAP